MAASMNSVERVRCAVNGDLPDRVPCVALIIQHAIRLNRVRYDHYAQDPQLLVDTQIRTWQTYGYDGFHVSSDNWVLPQALGCPVRFFPDQPPVGTEKILAENKDLSRLTRPQTGTEGRMAFKVEATRLAVEAVGDRCHLKTCFDQGPFTLASALRGIENLMTDCYDDPTYVHDLLEICTDAIIKFAVACGQARPHALTFGDSAAGLLNRDLFEKFALPYEKQVAQALAQLDIPTFLHICGNTAHIVDLMGSAGFPGLEVDYQNDIAFYKEKTGGSVCLQGNLEPAGLLLNGSGEQVRQAAREALEQGMPGGRFILSAGCDIFADTPSANIKAMVDACGEFGTYE